MKQELNMREQMKIKNYLATLELTSHRNKCVHSHVQQRER